MLLALLADHIRDPKASTVVLRSVMESRAASDPSLNKECIPTCTI